MQPNPASPGVRVAETYEDLRPLLFSIAYRMLGSIAEAEDIVQETFVRYQSALLEHEAEVRLTKGVSLGGHDPARDRPAALRPRPQGELHRRVAARAAADRRAVCRRS